MIFYSNRYNDKKTIFLANFLTFEGEKDFYIIEI
jgi:hypothetical protein